MNNSRLIHTARHLMMTVLLVILTACAGTGASDGTPTYASLSGDGPYEIRAYTSLPEAPEFGDATVYYPIDADRPVGGVAIAPGFTEGQRHINWWGPRLASHGFAVLVFNTNGLRDQPNLRGEGLIAAVRMLKSENARDGSPVNGRIDVDKMAIMGHSMGGGGALYAANLYSAEIQAAIPFTSWFPDGYFSNITVPTLVIAGSADTIAEVAEHAWLHYLSIPGTTPKVYMEVDGGGHFIADSTRGEDLGMIGRYGIAWLKLYLDEDERYRDFIFGDAQKIDNGVFSRYIVNP
ncbi:MAG: hypothetical protein WDZ76_03330 [Pseudohongiellaceae bacterium]